MNNLSIFQFEGSTSVRVIDQIGQPWFVAKDVCDVLGIQNSRDMIAKQLDSDEVEKTYITDSLGRQQETHIISESGLYALIIRSNKPNARKFRKWITSEVLPAIRKTGQYVAPVNNLPSSEVLMATLYTEMEKRMKAEAEAEEYKKNLRRIAMASSLSFGEVSDMTGLPKDIVVAAHCKSSKRSHAPQYARYIQLVLPMQEIVDECRRQIGII